MLYAAQPTYSSDDDAVGRYRDDYDDDTTGDTDGHNIAC